MQALPEDGVLVACEKDEKPLEMARDFWQRAGVSHKVQYSLISSMVHFSVICSTGLAFPILHVSCTQLPQATLLHAIKALCFR